MTGRIFGAVLGVALLVCGGPLAAGELTLRDTLRQGALIRGETEPGTQLALDGEALRVSETGQFVFGLDRDAPATAVLSVTWPDGSSEERPLEVQSFAWDVQSIDGLPPSKVTPQTEEQLAKIKQDAALKWAARHKGTDATWFSGAFNWPIAGIITGRFGNQRILNGEPKRPHYGVDIAAPEGTPIHAPADGLVTLAEDDLYFEGGTVFIDHGHDVIDVFLHMSDVTVEAGQQVKKGDVIGAVGATGRATGPHLCWRMFWRDAHVDPSLLAGEMPAP